MESIHGHDVMQMMIDSKESFTKDSLEKAIIKKFGNEARFHTCSAKDMTAYEIIEFLESKGKFIGSDQGKGFRTDSSQICSH